MKQKFYAVEGAFTFYRQEEAGGVRLYKVHSESGCIVDETFIPW